MPTVLKQASDIFAVAWPAMFPQPADSSLLDQMWMEPLRVEEEEGVQRILADFYVESDIPFSLPGLDAFSLVVKAGDEEDLANFRLELAPESGLEISGILCALRLNSDLFRPAKEASGGEGGVRFVEDPETEWIEIDLAALDFRIGDSGYFTITGNTSFDLPPVMIGESGIVVSAESVELHLDGANPPAGMPVGWKGFHIASGALYVPADLDLPLNELELTDAYIGNGGFTGSVSAEFGGADAQVGSLDISVQSLEIDIIQNALAGFGLGGSMVLPFFEEEVDIEVSLDLGGGFSIAIASEDGLLELDNDILNLNVDFLEFETGDGEWAVALGGLLRPNFASEQINWPSFDIERLSIDSRGHVKLDGGWLNLPKQYSLDFNSFRIDISAVGFGYEEDNSRWIGFSGGIKLVEGLPAGVSVEGLRIIMPQGGGAPRFALNGVGVELEIPNVLQFKGEISYRQMGDVHRFDGLIELQLLPLDLSIEAQLVIGSAVENGTRYQFMAIYLGVELPVGIPLWSTGLALYGTQGLFAYQMHPDKEEGEPWFGLEPGEGWYRRDPVGVTELEKWTNYKGALGFGAGITIGTLPDNGFTFSGNLALVIVIPGPRIIFEGKANVLRERSKLDEEPIFRALAVLDLLENTFTFGLDMEYKYLEGGRLMTIQGSAELFVHFQDPMAWHLYLGQKEPRERRIRARTLELFESNAYFQLDAYQFAFGFWSGYDADYKFGPLRVLYQAWLESNVALSYDPPQFFGEIAAHGAIGVSVFGFGFELSGDARLAAVVLEPFQIEAEIAVRVKLPWPLPKFKVKIELKWGPREIAPPIAAPLHEIAIEHLKVTNSWPLAILEADHTPPGPEEMMVIPLDGKPHISFRHSVVDDSLVGVNTSTPEPGWVTIGDPDKGEGTIRVRYHLQNIRLEKRFGNSYGIIAQGDDEDHPLFGSWAMVPEMAGGSNPPLSQTKLWVWNKNPFEYFRHEDGGWMEWVQEHYPEFPCPEEPRPTQQCFDFEDIPLNQVWLGQLAHPDDAGLELSWIQPVFHFVEELTANIGPYSKGLSFPLRWPNDLTPATIQIQLPYAACTVGIWLRVKVARPATNGITVTAYAEGGAVVQSKQVNGALQKISLDSEENNIVLVRISSLIMLSPDDYSIAAICLSTLPDPEGLDRQTEVYEHFIQELERWSGEEPVLEPWSEYRLRIDTGYEVESISSFEFDYPDDPIVQYAYFRTLGPPGLVELSDPNAPTEDNLPVLGDLSLYVNGTVPASIPASGEINVLSRPVFRAYDIGVIFNETYVDFMYKVSGRDLTLQLFNSNNDPVRNAMGQLVVLPANWEYAGKQMLSAQEQSYIELINNVPCLPEEIDLIPGDLSLFTWSRDLVLDPDITYQARLIPTLFAEDFALENEWWEEESPGNEEGPAQWDRVHHDGLIGIGLNISSDTIDLQGSPDLSQVLPHNDVIFITLDTVRPSKVYRILEVDADNDRIVVDGEPNAPGDSNWQIPASGAMVQTSNILGGPSSSGALAKPGTQFILSQHPQGDHQPSSWTDYRLSAVLYAEDDDEMGLIFRYSDAGNLYRFSMSRQYGYRRLVKLSNGEPELLAEDNFTFTIHTNYKTSVEAVGSNLRVFQNDMLVFEVDDGEHASGSIGLYCWAQEGARFSRLRVEDFSELSPTVFHFEFTSSWFANFYHLVHSFDRSTWALQVSGGIAIGDYHAEAVSSNNSPLPREFKLYDELSYALLGAMAHDQPESFSISRIFDGDSLSALLVQSPEPLRWDRLEFRLRRTTEILPEVMPPGKLKLTSLSLEADHASAEQLRVLLRHNVDPEGYRVQYPSFDGLRDTGVSDLLFSDAFIINDLGDWSFEDDGIQEGPSDWVIENGHLVQMSNILTPANTATLVKAGTRAMAGEEDWEDYVLSVRVQSQDDDEFGILFRFQDLDNHYRFVWNNQMKYRRLIRVQGGEATLLWKDVFAYPPGVSFSIRIWLQGGHMLITEDSIPLLDIVDEGPLEHGRFGLFCWANVQTRFSEVKVHSLAGMADFIWSEEFNDHDLADWTRLDEVEGESSSWAVTAGTLIQSSNIHNPGFSQDELDRPGTYLLHEEEVEGNWRFRVSLSSGDNDGIGALFNYRNDDNYLRFSMNRQEGRRQLVSKSEGSFVLLWEDSIPYQANDRYELVIDCVDGVFIGYINALLLFRIESDQEPLSRFGLYSWGNTQARFHRVSVEASGWKDYYVFGEDRRYPEGSVFAIASGEKATFAPGEVGKVLPESARGIYFSQQSQSLRLLDPEGIVADEAVFLAQSHFANYGFRVLRRADATGLFLFRQGGQPGFQSGSYQLSLRFRRDNTTVDPESVVWRQAGEATDEVANVQFVIP